MSEIDSSIGKFVIGVSRIGGDEFDWRKTVISQYGNSPILLALIELLNLDIDPQPEVDNFYDMVWNIATAQGWGLDVWGRIVNVSRILTLPETDFFGFKQGGYEPFGQAPLYRVSNSSTNNFALSDEAYRLLILVKALANISNCAIPTMNQILMFLFPDRGNAFVSDTGNMTERLTFSFPLSAFEIAILKYSGAFPTPTGVEFNIIALDPATTFGFKQGGYAPLGHGTLFGGFE